jgi:SPP1 family predicted phage head-tail adaptor
MQARHLDRIITLERFTETRDAFNNPVLTWGTLATVRASVEHIRDAERWTAQEVGAAATMRFQVRWSSTVADLDAKDRLVYEGDTFNITAVKELGRREGLEITAAARAD